MNTIKQQVIEFLRHYQMEHSDIDLAEYCQIFVEEMRRGLAGESSSLPMIPTYLEVDQEIPCNRPVIVLDAGGTNFRVATVYFTEDREPVIEHFRRYPMPGVREEVSKERFFQIIADFVRPVVETSPKIGFCFSYPTEIFPNKDGRLLHFSKEIQAKEVEGELIGQTLAETLQAEGQAERKHIVMLNDTVATLLAGKVAFRARPFENYLGFILGTGLNCCYIEANSRITKKPELEQHRRQIVNIEAGTFGKGPRGQIDRQFDADTTNPGMYGQEKMISGRYLGALCLATLQQAAEAGLFSTPTAEILQEASDCSTKDVNDFLHFPPGPQNPLAGISRQDTEADQVAAYLILDRMVERAAKLAALNLAGPIIATDTGRNPCAPVCITAEGTTFYELRSLKKRTEYYLKSFLEDRRDRFYELVSVENATLIGAAIAGLTN